MNKLAVRILGIFVILYAGTTFFGLGQISSVNSAVLFALIFLIVNTLLKPILLLLSLPITLLTFGLFSLVVNTWIVLITDAFVGGIHINGFFSGLILSIGISVFHWFFVKPMEKK